MANVKLVGRWDFPVVQWLKLRLLMQGAQLQSLVQGLSSCMPRCQKYQNRTEATV